MDKDVTLVGDTPIRNVPKKHRKHRLLVADAHGDMAILICMDCHEEWPIQWDIIHGEVVFWIE